MDVRPGLAPVLGPVDSGPGHVQAGRQVLVRFDVRDEDARVGSEDVQVDLARDPRGQAVGQLAKRPAPVRGLEHPALGSAAGHRPGLSPPGIEADVHDVRFAGIQVHVRGAHVRRVREAVRELGPAGPAVGGLVQPPAPPVSP
jgi:hypothetical protein